MRLTLRSPWAEIRQRIGCRSIRPADTSLLRSTTRVHLQSRRTSRTAYRQPKYVTVSPSRGTKTRGFTLIELIIVIAIIGILASIALPAMRHAPLRAREAVLKEDLYQIRSCIDQHLADKGAYPGSLESLCEAGYLRFIPVDPILGVAEWEEIFADAEDEEDLQPYDDEFGHQIGIHDIRSKSMKTALDGTLYADW